MHSVALGVFQAPAVAMGMTCLAMTRSIGAVMQNAASNQQCAQMIAAAAVSQALVLIINSGEKKK